MLYFLCIRYHVPRAWFKPSGNVLVLFEEKGGDPDKIRFVRRKISGACALVAEDYPSIGLLSQGEDKIQNNKNIPFARLTCPSNTHISAVKFASFGTPSGSCGSFLKGDCHDPNSSIVVEKVCLFAIFCIIPCFLFWYLKWKISFTLSYLCFSFIERCFLQCFINCLFVLLFWKIIVLIDLHKLRCCCRRA